MTHTKAIPQIDINNASPEQLRQHVEVLRFKLEKVMPDDGDISALQIHYNLTSQQALILAALSNGRLWTSSQLMSVAAQWKADVDRQVVKVQISRLRHKLPKSIEITTEWGVGYHVTHGIEELQKVISEMKGA